MSIFTYNDVVRVVVKHGGAGRKAWVVGIFETDKEPGDYWKNFSPGVVYAVEFEDGASAEVHEDSLELWSDIS